MSSDQPPARSTASRKPRFSPAVAVRALREFLDTEVIGGVVLLVATVVALAWANSPWRAAYDALWSIEIGLPVRALDLTEDLRHWINDGLMALFFFVVGLEIKRELVEGELAQARRAALPAVAALGGMVVPAALYAALNAGSDGAAGWGVPMATDIAFALGVLALLRPRVPSSLKVFLLSLAIVDDIGAIVVIALFYSDHIQVSALVLACALLAAVVALRAVGVRWMIVYALLGAATWLATKESGVHATISGVAVGLLTPARGPHSVAERLEHALHPWTSYAVVPLFALANAGITLGGDTVASALGSRVTLGVLAGLVVGKVIGITGFAWAAHRLGLGTLPDEVSWGQLCAAAAVAGIGFTVSIFIASLAFSDGALIEEAKIGVLAASVLSALLGAILIRLPPRSGPDI